MEYTQTSHTDESSAPGQGLQKSPPKAKKIKKRPRIEVDFDEMDSFKEEMRSMISTMLGTFTKKQGDRMSQLERQINEVKLHTTAIADIEKSVGFISSQVTDIQKKIEHLEKDRNNMKKEVEGLKDRIDLMDKSSRKTSIEIRSIAKKQGEKKEDLFNMVKSLLKTLNIDFSSADLRDVYRIPSKADINNTALIAEFSNTLLKETVLNKSRLYNKNRDTKLQTRHLGITGNSAQIFVSELLTAKTKRLFYLARDLARTENYSFCWTSNGNIYLRKKEGMPHIIIKSEEQIQELKKSAASAQRQA